MTRRRVFRGLIVLAAVGAVAAVAYLTFAWLVLED